MQLSARNQLRGTVKNIELGTIMATVVIELPGGQEVAATITKASVENLGLKVGAPAMAVIKATEVMVGVE
ncbi:MAG: molybdopterin-binding protein [Actinomycetaceae bacterium]|nr:molybdopterin-binding protein [Actinomycetaceae bacterium]